MENEDTRLPLDKAHDAAMEDYAQRVTLVIGTDRMLCTMLAVFAVMQGVDSGPDSVRLFNEMKNRVRAVLNDPRIVAKQQEASIECDCSACQMMRKLDTLIDEYVEVRAQEQEAEEAE